MTQRNLAVLLLALSGCATISRPLCTNGQQPFVQEVLYFGTDTPSGRVAPQDWAQFLAETVTPRFPEGLTVWPASGQWRSASGTVVQEPSYVLSLFHPESAAAETAVRELVASYKARFQQEAVLRVRSSNVCVSF